MYNENTLLKRNLLIAFVFCFIAGLVFFVYSATRKIPTVALAPIETFILMGDSGTGMPVQTTVAKVVDHYCSEEKNCRAVFILGDVIYDDGVASLTDEKFQSHFEVPYADITLPFYIVFGNHDYRGCTQCYLDYTELSQKWKMPARYYAQAFASVLFLVVDTENFDKEQQTWLTKELSESTAPHKVVLGHRPILSDEVEKHTEDWQGKKDLTDIVCTQANYYVSGHAHILEDPGPLEGCTVKLLIAGTAGTVPRQIAANANSPFYAMTNGFLAFTTRDTILEYSFVDKNGQVLERK
jgi:tartrate-resistant acid phosphatase type 5